jgi:hypothetical protein
MARGALFRFAPGVVAARRRRVPRGVGSPARERAARLGPSVRPNVLGSAATRRMASPAGGVLGPRQSLTRALSFTDRRARSPLLARHGGVSALSVSIRERSTPSGTPPFRHQNRPRSRALCSSLLDWLTGAFRAGA